MSFVVVQTMGSSSGLQTQVRRAGRERVAVLAFLMLVIVSSIAMVGNRERAGKPEATLSAGNGVQRGASLLARLQQYPGIAARADSLERLRTGSQMLDGAWGVQRSEAAEDAERADASAKLQMMQMQVIFTNSSETPPARECEVHVDLCLDLFARKVLALSNRVCFAG
jgi:hypothetical protein